MNSILNWFMQVTIATAIMVPFVIGLAWLFSHRPSVQHALWVVVLVKFVTPPIVSLPVQLPTMIAGRINPSPHSNDSLRSTVHETRPIESGFGKESDMDFDISYDASSAGHDSEDTALTRESVRPLQRPAVSKQLEDQGASRRVLFNRILLLSWVTGALFIATRHVRRISRQLRLLRDASPANRELRQCVIEVAQHLKVRPLPTLVVSGIASPFVWCLGHLKLVWPFPMAEAAPDRASKILIAHELSQVRRCDHWIAWLEMIAGVIWWWNPLFWFVRGNIRITAEMSCDALALAAYPEDRSTYAETLFALSVSKTGAPPLVLAVGGGAPSSLERRIRMMMSEQVSGKLSLTGFLVVTLVAIATIPALSLAQDGGDEALGKQPATSNEVSAVDEEARIGASEEVRSIRKTLTKSSQGAPQNEGVRSIRATIRDVANDGAGNVDQGSIALSQDSRADGELGIQFEDSTAAGGAGAFFAFSGDVHEVQAATITEKTQHRLKARLHARA